MLATAPTAYRRSCGPEGRSALSGLRAAVSGGRAHSARDLEKLRDRLGLRVIDGIGATELLHIFISAAGDEIRPGRHRQAGARLPRHDPRPGRRRGSAPAKRAGSA